MQCGAGARPEWVGKRLVAVKRMKRVWERGWEEAGKLKELEVSWSCFRFLVSPFFLLRLAFWRPPFHREPRVSRSGLAASVETGRDFGRERRCTHLDPFLPLLSSRYGRSLLIPTSSPSTTPSSNRLRNSTSSSSAWKETSTSSPSRGKVVLSLAG